MVSLVRRMARWLTVALAFYFATMLVVSIFGDLITVAKFAFREGDRKQRHELPIFDDKDRAKRIFKDSKVTIEAYAPYVGWRRLELRTETVNIGPDGLRIHHDGRDNDPGSLTVGFFGGSGIWGTGVDDDGTIPAIFDQITKNYEVLNYGEGSWTSRQSLAQLINLINQGAAPDIAIFYTGANDATIGCDLGHGDGYNSHKNARYYRRLVLDSEARSYLYRNFVVPTIDTFRRVTGRGKDRRVYVCDHDPKRTARIASTMFKNWQIARTLMQAEGGRFYAFLHPIAGVGSPSLDHLALDSRLLAQYPPVYAAVKTLIDQHGQGWAWDISDSFDGGPAVYMDESHVTRTGNAIVADRIRDILSGT